MNKKEWKIECSPYAMKVIKDQVKHLKNVRESMPPMSDSAWKEYVMDQIEWKKLNQHGLK